MEEKKHVGCYAVITNDNKIILIRKSKGAYIGKLDLPGGRIDHNELPIQTVEREIFEEVGVNTKDIKLIDATAASTIYEDNNITKELHHIGMIYKVTIDDTKELKTDADGLDSLGSAWYEIDKLKKKELSPFAYKAITEYIK